MPPDGDSSLPYRRPATGWTHCWRCDSHLPVGATWRARCSVVIRRRPDELPTKTAMTVATARKELATDVPRSCCRVGDGNDGDAVLLSPELLPSNLTSLHGIALYTFSDETNGVSAESTSH